MSVLHVGGSFQCLATVPPVEEPLTTTVPPVEEPLTATVPPVEEPLTATLLPVEEPDLFVGCAVGQALQQLWAL